MGKRRSRYRKVRCGRGGVGGGVVVHRRWTMAGCMAYVQKKAETDAQHAREALCPPLTGECLFDVALNPHQPDGGGTCCNSGQRAYGGNCLPACANCQKAGLGGECGPCDYTGNCEYCRGFPGTCLPIDAEGRYWIKCYDHCCLATDTCCQFYCCPPGKKCTPDGKSCQAA
jgi:hypothetical protein